MDQNDNGVIDDPSETVDYRHILNAGTNIWEIQRREGGAGGAYFSVADNIDAFDLVYFGWRDNGSGVTLTVLNGPGGGAVAAADRALINSVQITIVARSGRGDPGYVDQTVYANQQGTVIFTPTPANNNFRRRIITIKTQCRNQWYRS